MRLTLVALIAVLCLAYAHAADDAQPDNEQVIGLLDVADQGASHANDGAREARHWGGGYGGYGGYGGWGHGGGWGRGYGGGWNRGWGGRGWGHGGYGRGGYGWGR
ncbi:neuropeptide-like protein 32 [Drosophila serrata]|uniref:neuropeptide-like protein 32 n=1 Tax=Drosophila serrata TaxID=7274 RepID=UPI000A1D15AA|nr:neuropeptide-like protein 32 [Drosophila serrata]